jgi:hypothetical protein
VNFPGLTNNKCATGYKGDFDVNDLVGFSSSIIVTEEI